MADALRRVKDELGRDAVILSTRSFQGGGLLRWGGKRVVEIVAAQSESPREPSAAELTRSVLPQLTDNYERISVPAVTSASSEPPEPIVRSPHVPAAHWTAPAKEVAVTADPHAEPKPRDSVDAAQKSDVSFDIRKDLADLREMINRIMQETRAARLPSLPAELVQVYTDLVARQVADDLARDLLAELAPVAGQSDVVRTRLAERVAEMVPTSGPLGRADGRPYVVALVGPTGMGKTTTLAKLAANAKLHDHRRVGLITLDLFRIGAVDQLRIYASILDIPLVSVDSVDEMPRALSRLRDCDLVLMDTAGRAPADQPRLDELRGMLNAARPDEVHLVLSTTQAESAALEAINKFAALGADRLLFTKLDEAVGFGVILNVLRKVNLRLSYVTDGQAVPSNIAVAVPSRIADWVLGIPAETSADTCEASS